MTHAVTVHHQLPEALVAISAECAAEVARLTAAAQAIEVVDLPTLEEAEALFVEIDSLSKAISAQRLETTRPLDALKKQLIDAEKGATKDLQRHREALGGQTIQYRRRLEQERREAERRAREEAERRERERREREEAARRAAEEARQAAQREAQRIADEEAALFGGVAEPVVVAPVAVKPEPEPDPEPAVALPAVPDTPAAVRTVRRTRVEIHDEQALLAAACRDGGRLYGRQVLVVDRKSAEALAKAGCDVPGVRLVEVESIASTGRR